MGEVYVFLGDGPVAERVQLLPRIVVEVYLAIGSAFLVTAVLERLARALVPRKLVCFKLGHSKRVRISYR